MAAINNRWFIYALLDPRTAAVRYVGKSVNPRRRLQSHCSAKAVAKQTHTACWLRSLLDVGLSPSLVIIDGGRGNGHAAAERAWIAEYRRRGAHLTNHSDGGECELSAEFRAKLSASQMGRKMSPEAIEKSAAKRRGKKLGSEARRHMSEARKGYQPSEEHRQKLSEAGKGRTLSPEIREKVAASKRGKPRPDVAARMRGRIMSDEARARIGAANSGRVRSPEHIAKLRAGHRAYCARKKANQTNNGEPEEGQ